MSSSALGKAFMPGLIVTGVIGLLVLRGGFVFLLLALLPAVIAYYVDNDATKSKFKTVLACNLAATLPTLLPMIKAGMQMKQYDVSVVMSNPSVWLFVYVGAAAGWCLIFLCRLVSRLFIALSYEYKITTLEKTQRKLLDEWGQQLEQKSS